MSTYSNEKDSTQRILALSKKQKVEGNVFAVNPINENMIAVFGNSKLTMYIGDNVLWTTEITFSKKAVVILFRPDGDQITVGGQCFFIYDTNSGRKISNYDMDAGEYTHLHCYSPDGNYIVFGNLDAGGMVSMDSKHELIFLKEFRKCSSAVFDKKGNLFLGQPDGSILRVDEKLLSKTSWCSINHVPGAYNPVRSMSLYNHLLVSGNNTICIWDTVKQCCTHEYQSKGTVVFCQWVSNNLFVSATRTGHVHVWNVITNEKVQHIHVGSDILQGSIIGRDQLVLLVPSQNLLFYNIQIPEEGKCVLM